VGAWCASTEATASTGWSCAPALLAGPADTIQDLGEPRMKRRLTAQQADLSDAAPGEERERPIEVGEREKWRLVPRIQFTGSKAVPASAAAHRCQQEVRHERTRPHRYRLAEYCPMDEYRPAELYCPVRLSIVGPRS